ncbi:MAG: hypothetical protein CMJ78_04505 [Planctomycetaceae bacterium]|nr:hypothetical protein [Planctomycetaceae bacterium]
MLERSRPRLVNLGIIGLGGRWESDFQPALEKLRDRVAIRVIQDCVLQRADTASKHYQSVASSGVMSVLSRCDIDAVLVLDSGWYQSGLLAMLGRTEKPAFLPIELLALAHQEFAPHNDLVAIHENARETGRAVFPELTERYSPATWRLQELTATKLGAIKGLDVVHHGGLEHDDLTASIDWCCHLFGCLPTAVMVQPYTSDQIDREVKLMFETQEATLKQARIRFLGKDIDRSMESVQSLETSTRTVTCDKGRATLTGPTQIFWECQTTEKFEDLSAERTNVEVMLDHFCRRVSGGLIPVPDLGDVLNAWQVAKTAMTKLRTKS